jgi:threonine synthase
LSAAAGRSRAVVRRRFCAPIRGKERWNGPPGAAARFVREGFYVRYVSTRGASAAPDFEQALIAGLARDGGLLAPESYPAVSADLIRQLPGRPYAQAAEDLIAPYVGRAIAPDDLSAMLRAAYAGFDHPAVAPLVQLGDNLFLLELFHGPTLAFKDLAMQPLGRMMDHVLRRRGERATVVGATSGDTGAAAIEAFKGLEGVDVFILYPHERVSEVQRRQMTCVAADNVHVIALEGTFDDCQAAVKGLFDHHAFRDELRLAGVNSINWARVMLQTVYYFTSAAALGAPDRRVSFAVPTGNFGDVLAGWIAKRMGLPVERLVVATNQNDILARAFATGAYEVREVHATQSPSMDIQVSSNFERLLFEAYGREPAAVRAAMASLGQSRRFDIPATPLARLREDFDALRTGETGTRKEIARVFAETGRLLDPHTAVAAHAARKILAQCPATPMIVLGTAHPAKFPDAVEAATGERPRLPPRLADLATRPERFTILPNDSRRVEAFIRARARVGAAA